MIRIIAALQGAGLALLALWVELQVGSGWHTVTQTSIGTVGIVLAVAGICLAIGRMGGRSEMDIIEAYLNEQRRYDEARY